MVLRMYAFRCHMFKSLTSVIDVVVVVSTSVDLYILKPMGSEGANMSFGRLARIFKVFKMLRAFRAAKLFSELRILGKTVFASLFALFWSAVLLAFVIVCSGLFMAQTVEGIIVDPALDYDLRVWAYKRYGSGMRASYTMFEATLSGGWPNYARTLVEENVGFAFFWIMYVMLVIFAIIRVITALFLKTTIKVSQDDEEMMLLEKMREKEDTIKKIRQFLSKAD